MFATSQAVAIFSLGICFFVCPYLVLLKDYQEGILGGLGLGVMWVMATVILMLWIAHGREYIPIIEAYWFMFGAGLFLLGKLFPSFEEVSKSVAQRDNQ